MHAHGRSMENPLPTNILKLAMAIHAEDAAGVQQVVFYDPGVGTDNGLVHKLAGGALGAGLDKNILQLYTFLSLNYDHGDDIYLFGFSRGAYTVRSIAGMIDAVGLVRRKHVQFVKEAYDLYRTRHTSQTDPSRFAQFRSRFGDRVRIKLVACFDTVGSLGIPFSGLPLSFDAERYRFHDMVLGERVEHAIHVLSIEEQTFGKFQFVCIRIVVDDCFLRVVYVERYGNMDALTTDLVIWHFATRA